MSSFDASQCMRYAMDFMLAVPSVIGVSEYSIYLINVINDQIGFNDTSINEVITETRLLVADGYRTYAAGDGYLNPCIKQETGQNLVLSNGQLTTNKLILGPLVFPYTCNNFSGGLDSMIFQPPVGTNSNQQIFIQIRGNALSPNGNYFDVEEINIADMGGLSYYLVLKANLEVSLS